MNNTIKLSMAFAALFTSLNATDLGTVTVTSATKSEQSIKDVTSNITLITKEEIEEKNYLSLVDILKNVTGLNVISNGGLGSTTSVNLRGMGNNRSLVLVDGIRLQDPSSTSGANLSHIMASDIERIEIIKGAQSGIWGADASAGVINIITKSASKGVHTSANIEYGSFNTKKYGAGASYKNESLELKLSANKITSDSFSVQAPSGENVDDYEDDPYENTTLNFKAAYSFNDDIKVKLNFTNIDALKDYDSYGDPDDSTMQSDIKNTLYSASYLHSFDDHDFLLKYEKSKFQRDEIGTVAQWGSEYVKVFNGEVTNIELNDNYKYTQDSFLLLGLGMSSDNVDYIMTDSSTKEQENKNNYAYLTNSNRFGNTIFTQSVRYDNYDNFDNKSTGKLGVKHSFSDKLFISSNIGTAYNVPNIVQELNPWGAINTDLNPENATSFDFTFGYSGFELTYFHQKIEDLIEWYDPDGWGGNPAIYKNLDGKSTFKGFELQYSKELAQEVFISSNYTYLSAKDKDGKELARRAKHSANLSVDYYISDNLHTALYAQYIGERFDGADKSGAQTGKYVLANFVTNYDINKNFKTFLKIDNITDKEYQEVDGYATARRSYYVGLNVKY